MADSGVFVPPSSGIPVSGGALVPTQVPVEDYETVLANSRTQWAEMVSRGEVDSGDYVRPPKTRILWRAPIGDGTWKGDVEQQSQELEDHIDNQAYEDQRLVDDLVAVDAAAVTPYQMLAAAGAVGAVIAATLAVTESAIVQAQPVPPDPIDSSEQAEPSRPFWPIDKRPGDGVILPVFTTPEGVPVGPLLPPPFGINEISRHYTRFLRANKKRRKRKNKNKII